MRARILRVAVLAAVVAVTLFGSALAVAVHRLYYADERGELQRLALLGALSVPAELAVTDADPVELPATEESTRLAVYDTTGRRVEGTGPATADPVTRAALAGRVSEGGSADELVVAVPVISAESVVAVSRASSPRSVVQRRLWTTWLGMLALALVAGACATVLAALQARRLTRPLDALTAAAGELGGGNFATRVPSSGVVDIDRAGEALNRTARRLADLLARERAFTTQASHQLRTPLTALRLRLDTALAGPGTDLRPAAQEAVDLVDRLSVTIDDVLELARGGAEAVEPVDLDSVLEAARERWAGPLAAQGRALATVPADDPVAAGSPPAVRQVLDVLLDNALHHGAGTVRVVARETAEGAAAIDVCDEGSTTGRALLGTPVPARLLDAGSGGGSGDRRLGLAMAAALAEAQGGRLVHASTEATTRLTLLLPAAPERAGRP